MGKSWKDPYAFKTLNVYGPLNEPPQTNFLLTVWETMV